MSLDTPAAGSDRTRFWSVVSALLFLPAVPVTAILALLSDRASTCMMEGGDACGPLLPGWLFTWSAALGGLAFVVALAAPVAWRRAAFAVQLLAETVALAVVLSTA